MVVSNINSIINPESVGSEITDTLNPYTFVEFSAKYRNLTPSTAYSDYKDYITKWSNIKKSLGEVKDTKKLIANETINLLKIVIVSFATYEEQQFIANLDWTGSTASAKAAILASLPLFAKRIKEIAEFYKSKRTEATFTIERNKIKGTSRSIEKLIFDKVVQYIFNNADNSIIPNVQKLLNISIDNFVDVYSNYFDIDRTKSTPENWNDIDYRIYFELQDVLMGMMFDNLVYFHEIPLIAQYGMDLTQDCVGDKLVLKNQLIEDSELCLVPDTEKIKLRKKLFRKYLGVDFHYLWISADGTVYNDKFITAENPTNNLLNQQTVDAPISMGSQLEKLKNIGLFFRPGKTGMLRVNTTNYTYSIDVNKVERRKIYIFPDPAVYSNVSFNSQIDYPLVLEYSFDEYIKNIGFGFAKNDPFVTTDQQPVFAYYSKDQDTTKITKNNDIVLDFENIYNQGYIKEYKVDIYGNKFGLFEYGSSDPDSKWDDSERIPDPDKQGGDDPYLPVVVNIFDGGNFTDDKGHSADIEPYNLNDPHSYDFFIEAGTNTVLNGIHYRPIIIKDGSYTNPTNWPIWKINKYGRYGNGDFTKVIPIEQLTTIDGDEFTTNYNTSASEVEDLYFEEISGETTDETSTEWVGEPSHRDKGLRLMVNTNNNTEPVDFLSKFTWFTESDIENIIDFDIVGSSIILRSKLEDGSFDITIDNFEYDPVSDEFSRTVAYKVPLNFKNSKFSAISPVLYNEDTEKLYFAAIPADKSFVYIYEISTDSLNYNIYSCTGYQLDTVPDKSIELAYCSDKKAYLFGCIEENNGRLVEFKLENLPVSNWPQTGRYTIIKNIEFSIPE